MQTSDWVVIIAAIIGAAGAIIAVMIDDNPTPPTPINNSVDTKSIHQNLPKENSLPTISGLTSYEPTPQREGEAIHLEAAAFDPEDDQLFYKFLVNGEDQTGWTTDKTWTWDNTEDYIGDNQIEVWIRDGKHTDPNSFDDHEPVKFTIIDQSQEPISVSETNEDTVSGITPLMIPESHQEQASSNPTVTPATEANDPDTTSAILEVEQVINALNSGQATPDEIASRTNWQMVSSEVLQYSGDKEYYLFDEEGVWINTSENYIEMQQQLERTKEAIRDAQSRLMPRA